MSPIYKEPPVLKISPLRAQETVCRHRVGQISTEVLICHWPGLQELLSFPTWDVVITPLYPTKAVHCVAKDSRPLGILPERCAGTHGTLSLPEMLQCCHRWFPRSPFLGWCVLLLALLLVTLSCLPFLQMPWLRALCPSIRHSVSDYIPGDAESPRN